MANDNSPYNQTDYSSERLYTVGSTVTCPPLSPDEESRHLNLDARTLMDNRATDLRLEEPRFIISTRADCHISPERSDFTTLTPILPRPVHGLAGGSTYAVGRGTIVIHTDISAGRKLTLQDALFVTFSQCG